MADIFVSYTSSDRDWAFWIAQQLETFGHVAHVHEWEIAGGGDIMAWMEHRHDAADHVLVVVSERYLGQPYSSLERRAAQWAATDERPNLMLPVFVEPCRPPRLLAGIKRCDLYGLSEDGARARLKAFLAPPAKPKERIAFPASAPAGAMRQEPARFPGIVAAADRKVPTADALSNIPISVPLHFVGRDEVLSDIASALAEKDARVAITTLHGLRGVGKTTLAAAYAEQRHADYRATWWIRAETGSTMRADLVGLGVRLGWVAADEKEDAALATVMERLRHDGVGLLLIYDNAIDASSVRPYLPRGGAAHVLVTSNAPAWGAIAKPVEIELWPKEVGADYLIARTRRTNERAAAQTLSEVLGGLPLAHEQAAAYCEGVGIGFAEYQRRFETSGVALLDDKDSAPPEYHPEHADAHRDRLTVAGTFRLAIDEAAKRHPAAEPLIVHAALLAPEPIPLFLFSESTKKFDKPFATALAGDGLDKAVGALRAFALIDREMIADERDPAIETDCIRLHRLVRQVAAARFGGTAQQAARRALIEATEAAYPQDVFHDPHGWPRARRLDAHALVLVNVDAEPPHGAERATATLLGILSSYRHGALAAYSEARHLRERSLAILEKTFGPNDPSTAITLNDLAYLLVDQGDLATAQSLLERALAICEKALGPDHPETATDLANLATLRERQGDLAGARPLLERALVIREKTLGPEHPHTATNLGNLASLLQKQGDTAAARSLFERALAIHEKTLGPEHPWTATSLNNLARLLHDEGDLPAARSLFERALAIYEKAFGPEHPWTRTSRNNLAQVLRDLGESGTPK